MVMGENSVLRSLFNFFQVVDRRVQTKADNMKVLSVIVIHIGDAGFLQQLMKAFHPILDPGQVKIVNH
jgi:hypothetical protein